MEAEYIIVFNEYLTEYMHRVGIRNWRVDEWHTCIWYDGMVRLLPQGIYINDGKDVFLFTLAGGWRHCLEYVVSRLNTTKIQYSIRI